MVIALLLVSFTLMDGLAGRAAQEGASRQSLGPIQGSAEEPMATDAGGARGTCLRVYSVFELIKPNGQAHRADSISQ